MLWDIAWQLKDKELITIAARTHLCTESLTDRFSLRFAQNAIKVLERTSIIIVMQCPNFDGTSAEMLDVLNADEYIRDTLDDVQNILAYPQSILMGHQPFLSALNIWAVSSHYISEMNRKITRNH